MQSLSASGDIVISDAGVTDWAVPQPADPVEAVRTNLCDSDPLVRMQAAGILGEIGNLDDIGILADLLSLPTCPDEHPRERRLLVHAMERLSGTTREQFALSSVLLMQEDHKSRGSRGSDAMRGKKRRAEYYFYQLLIILSAVLFIFGCIMLILTWMDL